MDKIKILIVDDNVDIVEMIGIRLKANGYDVVVSHDGQDALIKARDEKPDIMLLDISMPGLDGFEVATRVKADAQTKDISIIMVTARGEREDVLRAIGKIGAAEYIIKPFRIETLLEKINYVLNNRSK
jgi:two-component system alkaline phosphatase synthesis response regulator PhoP